MKQPIELRKFRDFGQIISDSFTFIKENFKPLFIPLLIICGFFIILGTIATVFSTMKLTSMYGGDFDGIRNQSVEYIVSALLSALALVAAQACIHLVTLCYISVYVQKGNAQPTFDEVWGYFKFYFFRVFGASILISLLFIVGFVLCVLPGIYLFPILYLIIPIIVIENSSFSYAFNSSFRLIKENWWTVFGVLFVMSLIVGVASSFAGIPITIIAASSKFLSLKSFTMPLVIFFSILRNLLMLAYVLPAVAVCLCYFSLAEQKDGVGLLGRIENFGNAADESSDLPKEEY